jgi:ferredoxin-NADP reductase
MALSPTEIGGVLALAAAAVLGVRGAFAWGRVRVEAAERLVARRAAFRERVGDSLNRARALRRSDRVRWAGWRDLVITRVVDEAPDVRSFHLIARDGRPLAPFEPGQFLAFRLHPAGKGEGDGEAVIRCYSLSGDPADLASYRVTVKRLRGGQGGRDGVGSSHFHGLTEGDIVEAKAPSGHFFLDRESARPAVFIGAGIGATPVLAMAKAMAASPQAPESWLFLGAHDASQALFKGEAAALAEAGVRVVRCHAHPAPGDRPGLDHDEAGRITIDLLRRLLPDGKRRFHLCGPPGMMADLVAGLAAWGVAEGDILYEAFGPATVRRAAPPPEGEGAPSSEVVFARSGKTRPWEASAGSLLDLAEASGLSLEAGCRAGNCGTCALPLTEGEVTYLSPPGAPPEPGICLPCVCIPKGRVVLQA